MGVGKKCMFLFWNNVTSSVKNDGLLLIPYRSVTKGTICVGPSGPTLYLYQNLFCFGKH